MSHVIAPSLRIVFCEGRPGSLDNLLLGHLLPVGQALIHPAGGKRGMRAYIEGYIGSYRGACPAYLVFRDRDFDVEPSPSPELLRLPGEKPVYLCHRAAVENYLIDTDLIYHYWQEREGTPTWRHGPAPSKDKITLHIRESAHELADYQAVRWALAKLRPGPRWPEVETTWTDGSGEIPLSLSYDDCLDEAMRLVEAFQSQVRGVLPAQLRQYADQYREQFSDEQFFERGEYLVWFHGKDHLKQLCRRLTPTFPCRDYADWAAQHVNARQHPDLQQLITLVSTSPEAR